jgi:hypothetical protein
MFAGKDGFMCQHKDNISERTGGYLVCGGEPGRLKVLYPVPS